MGSVLVAIFWIWCGISIVILIARPFYRRAKARSAPAASPADSTAVPAIPSLTRSSTIPDRTRDLDDFEPTSLFETPIRDGSLFERPDPAQPLDEEDPQTVDDQGEAASPGPGDVGRAESFVGGPGAIPVRTLSVADVLAGIRMPCDLAPLTGSGVLDDASHVVFATEGHSAHRVGVSVGDELERIGCRLEPVDATTLWAERGSESLEVRIHPDAAKAMDGEERRFPTASEGAVVVEFSIR